MAEQQHIDRPGIEMPAPTFWPMVLAFGFTLILGGIVTHYAVSIVGFVICVKGVLGWWRNVIPHEEHEVMPIDPAGCPAPICVGARSVVRLRLGEGGHRTRVPEEIHPYSSGIIGGLAGGAVMAGLACLYGFIAQHSIWYPVNLLAGAVIPDLATATDQYLRQFHLWAFIAAIAGHLMISMMVGVLYAVMLPMFPKYATLWAGILMPLIWSAVVSTTLDILNPVLDSRISWPWFIACQLGFGIVGGFVVGRSTSIRTMQNWTLAERAFIEAPPAEDEK